jgi:hypothetical protein
MDGLNYILTCLCAEMYILTQLFNCIVIRIGYRTSITAMSLSDCTIFRNFIFEQYLLIQR